MSNAPALKKKLRREVISLRQALSCAERERRSHAVVSRFLSAFPQPPKRVALYLPLADELFLESLFHQLLDSGCLLFFPRIESHDLRQLRFFAANPFHLELWKHAAWKIFEPLPHFECEVRELDLMVVPLLAMDRRGNRLGYGRGFYDAALADGRGQVQTVGLGYDFQLRESVPVEKNDVRLGWVITETVSVSVMSATSAL